MKTIYVIGSREIFDQRFAEFQSGQGHYYSVGFKNFGSVRHSIDGQLTLLEEEKAKFAPSDLAMEGVTIFESDENETAKIKCRKYITHPDRINNWYKEIEL